MRKKGAPKKVVVIGQGYVGLPLSMAARRAGFNVLGIDLDESRVRRLNLGISHAEDVSPEDLRQALAGGSYAVEASYANSDTFDFAVITVPTPLSAGKPDLSFIESAGVQIAPFVTRGSTVILESTTYPGTTDEMLRPILERGSGLIAGVDFFLGYSPERIDPGNSRWTLTTTPKIVSGLTADCLGKVAHFYTKLGINVVKVSGTRVAELTKLLENTFRHVNIALVNELALFSKTLDVDIWEAIEAADTKPFGFMKFLPGPGVGGHCLPVDPSYLSWSIMEKTGSDFQFVSLANTINSSMPRHVVERAVSIIREVIGVRPEGCHALVYGLAYKPESSDLRESPALKVIEMLQALGVHISAIDDYIPEDAWPANVARVGGAIRDSFDIGLLLTNHPAKGTRHPLESCTEILDTHHVLTGKNIHHL